MSSTGVNFFENFFSRINSALDTIVHGISGNVISTILPLVSIGVALYFSVFGLMTLLGQSEMPFNDLFKKILTVACVTAIAGAGGFYETQLVDVVQHLPEDFATALVTNNSGLSSANILDAVFSKGFMSVGELFERFSPLDGATWVYPIAAICLACCTIILVGIGGCFIMTAKVVTGLLAALGPIFIYAFIWPALRNFFNSWVNQVATYTIITVLFAAVYSFFLGIFTTYIDNSDFNGTQNIYYTIGGAVLLTYFGWHATKMLPQIASGLANGMHAGHGFRTPKDNRSDDKPNSDQNSNQNVPQNESSSKAASNAQYTGGWGNETKSSSSAKANAYKGKAA